MAGGSAGRDQRGPMERLVRIAAVLKAAGAQGVTADKLVTVAAFDGDDAGSQLGRDLKYLRQQGWQIDRISEEGEPGRYRMVTVDNRFRVRLSAAQQRALQRAVILADRGDLIARLGLPTAERPKDVEATLPTGGPSSQLSAVVRAVRHRQLLRFRYGGKNRLVHPESVRWQNERWYLRGREEASDVVKLYVVERMSDVRPDASGTADPPTPARSLALHPMRWQVDPPVEVTLRTVPEHRPDVERWLGEPLSAEDGSDSVDLHYEVTNRAALNVRLLELGPRVRIVGPAEVRDDLLGQLAAVVGEER